MYKKLLWAFVVIALLAFFFVHVRKKSTVSPFMRYASLIDHTYRRGFTNLDSQVKIPQLPIVGTIPKWLSGTLLRNGPAKFTHDTSWVNNWFDGLAMVHAFSFHDGVVSYANKFLITQDYVHLLKEGKLNTAGFLQDPCRTIFARVAAYFSSDQSPSMPNANVNIAHLNDKIFALTETPLPIEFDPDTLTTLGVFVYDDQYPKKDIHDTPHPHYDPLRKEYLGFFTQFGLHSTHNVFRIKDGLRAREVIASIPVDKPSYMHSFSITDRYVILTLLPLVANPLSFVLKDQAFIKNFTWQPERLTKLVVIDRINNSIVGTYTVPPFFAFHAVNAFEQDNMITMDIVTYPDSSVLDLAYFDVLLSDKPCSLYTDKAKSRLMRITIDLACGTTTYNPISDEVFELPRIHYEKYNGKPYQYVYGVGQTNAPAYVADKLIKMNVNTGDSQQWSQDNCYPGEPVFVPSPDGTSEDDGVVLCVVLDASSNSSFLLILDAHTFKPLGQALVPHHIPFGIHGMFKGKSYSFVM